MGWGSEIIRLNGEAAARRHFFFWGRTPVVLFVGPAHDDTERIIRQWPLPNGDGSQRHFISAYKNGNLACTLGGLRCALFFILTMFLVMVGTAAAGPVEDARDAKAAYHRGDFATALRLFRRAADQGHAEAQLNLGYMYFKGLGGAPYDYTEAAKWWLRAAEQGDAMAQRNVGMAYRSGQGVPKNRVLSLMWLNLAVARGNQRAAKDREPESVAQDMTPSEVTEAQRLANEWKPCEPRPPTRSKCVGPFD